MTDLDSLLDALNAADGTAAVPPPPAVGGDIPPPPPSAGDSAPAAGGDVPPPSADVAPPDMPPPLPPEDHGDMGGVDLEDLLEDGVDEAVVAAATEAQKQAEMLVSGELTEEALEIAEEDKEFESPEQRALRVIRLKKLNPSLEKYKLKVRLLDESEADYEVTSDWMVGNLIAAVGEALELGEATGLFGICEGNRTSNAPISAQNYERWFPREMTLEEAGLTTARASLKSAPPLYFRMRWFAFPNPQLLEDCPQLQHQVFLHVKRSMTRENIPLDQKLAIRQAALMLQASRGDYDPEKMPPSTIVQAPEGTFFNRSVAEGAGDLVKFEATIVDAYKHLKGMTSAAAEHEFIYSATSTWSPLSCGTVFNISGRTGVARRTVILPDGVAVEVGSTMRFHPAKDIAEVKLSDDLQTITITVVCPPNGATRDALPQEMMQFTTAEAQTMSDLLCGYVTILRPRFPKPALNTRETIIAPRDAPPLCLYAPTPLRDNILLEPSIAHAFYKKFVSLSEQEKIELPKKFRPLIERFLDDFPSRGFNEMEFCAQHALLSAATMEKIVISGAPPPSESDIPPLLPFPVMDRLDVSSWQLKPKQMHVLMASLAYVAEFMDKTGIAQNFVIRKLDLSCNPQVEPSVFFNDMRLLTTSRLPLTTLYLRKMRFYDEDAGNITSALIQCKTLETICFGDNDKLGGEACTAILNGLITDTPSLVNVSFINCGIDAKFIEKAQALIHRHKRPRKLTISQNKLDKNAVKAVCALLTACEPFDELEIRDCSLGSNAMKIIDVLPDCTTLKGLNISKNGIGDKCFVKLAGLIGEGRCYLQKLDISENDIGKKGYNEIFNAISSSRAYVVNLIMGNIKFPKGSAEALGHLSTSHLKSLDFKSSEMPRDVVKELTKVIISNKNLKSLTLSGNDFKGEEAVFDAIGTAIRSSEIEELVVSDCAVKKDVLTPLFRALAGAKKLKKIVLCGNKVTEHSLSALAALSNTPGSLLSSLEMRSLNTTQEAVSAFFRTLQKTPSLLQDIDLRFTPCLDMPTMSSVLTPFLDKIHVLL